MERKKLFEAARTGNVEVLNNLLQENPLILADFALASPTESLLHVATKAGQLSFIRELMKHNSKLSSELSKDGFRPIDIASVLGNTDIVKELLKSDREICRLQGKDQRTALHHAAVSGRVQVIYEILSTCPESIKDITVGGETALHLAVINNQVEAFSVLIKWLGRLNMKHIINWCDCYGNTILHLAASRKQLESIKLLLSNNDSLGEILEVNAINSKGLTAMDILDIQMENPNDVQLREILRHAGALVAQDVTTIPSANSLEHIQGTKQTKHELESEPPKNWFEYFKFQVRRDSPSDTRNALLVVAALIATVTFQAGVDPPTGILELTSSRNQINAGNSPPPFGPAATSGLAAASAILGTQAASFLFIFANTLGLTASLSIIIYLTGGFPFQRELLVSMYSMMFTYGLAIGTITKEKETVTYILLGIAFTLPFSLRWLPRWGKEVWRWWRRIRVNQTALPN